MSPLFETIQIENGRILNKKYHQERVNRSRLQLFNLRDNLDLFAEIRVPYQFKKGIVKCRVIYNRDILNILFEPYVEKSPRKIKLVEFNVEYEHKFIDRSAFESVLDSNPGFDDVIITHNGVLTDSTYCNLLFSRNGKWYTPEKPLLKGTRRAFLLDSGSVIQARIHVSELIQYDAVMLVNAMLEFDLKRSLPMSVLAI